MRARCSTPRSARSRTSRSGPRPKIEIALKVALLENLALKPRKAFGPIRVAATGASISPPLFESLELLGRDRSLQRLRAGRDRAAPPLPRRTREKATAKSLVVCTSARYNRRRRRPAV